jgi:hypothetical protein
MRKIIKTHRVDRLHLAGAVVLGVDADLDADPLDVDPDERDAIRRGIHKIPCQRDMEGTTGGGMPKTG